MSAKLFTAKKDWFKEFEDLGYGSTKILDILGRSSTVSFMFTTEVARAKTRQDELVVILEAAAKGKIYKNTQTLPVDDKSNVVIFYNKDSDLKKLYDEIEENMVADEIEKAYEDQ